MNVPKSAVFLALGALSLGVLVAAPLPAVAQDVPEATPEVRPEATVEPAATPDVSQPVTEYPGAQVVEAGGLRFLLPAEVANDVTVTVVEGVPFDPDIMASATYPPHVRIDFVDYLPDDSPEIARPFQIDPMIFVFQTADFAPYVDAAGYGYPADLRLLQGIIDGTIRRTADSPAPYLPQVNAAQIFHARQQVVRFHGGSGFVYLTSFAQDVYPVLEGTVQFVFQGVTDDGQTYISAMLPIDTGYFEQDLAEDFDFEEFFAGYEQYLIDAREALDAQPAGDFAPHLDALLALVGSFEVID